MAPLKDALLAIGTGIVGVFFLTSGFQTFGYNWAEQQCQVLGGVCIHPEWLAVGAGLVALAAFLWKRGSDKGPDQGPENSN